MANISAAGAFKTLFWLALIALGLWYGWTRYQAYVAANPEQFPWTPLDLADPVGPFTQEKLAALADDPQACLAILAAQDIATDFAPARQPQQAECGYDDGIALSGTAPAPRPADLVTACPVAAALYLWQRDVVAPAAATHFDSAVTAFSHYGSYNCRRLYGRSDGAWSRHATADAVDITGFTLADGKRISVRADWQGDGPKAAFLRTVRDGACDLFSSTLSPDYNAAHADHFHLAQREGAMGWSACR